MPYRWFPMTHVTFQLSGQALQTVKDLENKLLSLEQQDVGSKDRNGKEIRIWMDGAFDMMHYGE
jgi:ethanolamine-phosphate cytidylyltransferase